ncbi:MAG: hypothetical protein JO147_10710 [Actinobacteria bacterium]|nr:hypothetical protein [Actinomycetota bacterium]
MLAPSLVVIGMLLFFAAVWYVRRPRDGRPTRRWQGGDRAQSEVRLVQGPGSGSTVTVRGLPLSGAILPTERLGLGPHRDGNYLVVAVDPERRRTTAFWTPSKAA